jgi:hypothetical protein
MRKLVVVLVLAAAVFVWMRSSRARAPVSDGSYLAYEVGADVVRLTFTGLDGGRFLATLEYAGRGQDAEVMRRDTVDGRMRTPGGGIFEVGSFGPLWVPPGQVKEGGSAHGTRIAEESSWEGWDVGVVRASVGMGAALRGEWYYERSTGFLVGGYRGTAVSDQGTRFKLMDSNVEGLGSR